MVARKTRLNRFQLQDRGQGGNRFEEGPPPIGGFVRRDRPWTLGGFVRRVCLGPSVGLFGAFALTPSVGLFGAIGLRPSVGLFGALATLVAEVKSDEAATSRINCQRTLIHTIGISARLVPKIGRGSSESVAMLRFPRRREEILEVANHVKNLRRPLSSFATP